MREETQSIEKAEEQKGGDSLKKKKNLVRKGNHPNFPQSLCNCPQGSSSLMINFSSLSKTLPQWHSLIPIVLAIFQSTRQISLSSYLLLYYTCLSFITPKAWGQGSHPISNTALYWVTQEVLPGLMSWYGHIHWAQARFYRGRGQENSQVKSTGCAFFFLNPDSATY